MDGLFIWAEPALLGLGRMTLQIGFDKLFTAHGVSVYGEQSDRAVSESSVCPA